jgi:hypothetical protein
MTRDFSRPAKAVHRQTTEVAACAARMADAGRACAGGAPRPRGLRLWRHQLIPRRRQRWLRMITADGGLTGYPAICVTGSCRASPDRPRRQPRYLVQQIGGRDRFASPSIRGRERSGVLGGWHHDRLSLGERRRWHLPGPGPGRNPVLLASLGRNPVLRTAGGSLTRSAGSGLQSRLRRRSSSKQAARPRAVHPEMATATHPVWSPGRPASCWGAGTRTRRRGELVVDSPIEGGAPKGEPMPAWARRPAAFHVSRGLRLAGWGRGLDSLQRPLGAAVNSGRFRC